MSPQTRHRRFGKSDEHLPSIRLESSLDRDDFPDVLFDEDSPVAADNPATAQAAATATADEFAAEEQDDDGGGWLSAPLLLLLGESEHEYSAPSPIGE